MSKATSPSGLAAMASALHTLRASAALAPRGAEDYDRLRAVLCGGKLTVHRGETILSVAKSLCEWVELACGRLVGALVTEGDFPEEDWRRAFAAVDAFPETAEEHVAYVFAAYPTLFARRAEVLDHLFATVGNGYTWRAGVLVEQRAMPRRSPAPRPLVDDGEPVDFYPPVGLAAIDAVPDDVRPDWLALARETAAAMRDRAGGEHGPANRERGARVLAELDRRFPSPKPTAEEDRAPGPRAPLRDLVPNAPGWLKVGLDELDRKGGARGE